MRVMMLGLRGFPGVMGGVETHAENLCPLLVRRGCSVEVIVRSPYQPAEIGDEWRGVRFRPLWAPRSKRLETVVHTLLGVLYAAVRRPDILHIHAIGPALWTPLARILGLRVVVTHHGPDYEREKWGGLARIVLRQGERMGMRWANARIAISGPIEKLIHEKYRRDCAVIPNGVVPGDIGGSDELIRRFGLASGKYVLIVSRLVPEKRHHDLIAAFLSAAPAGWKLAIVGGSDHPDDYTQSVLASGRAYANVVCTGIQSGPTLRQLYSHAGIFVLPSSHEGLPIALLEALSYGLPVIASDIPANRDVGLPAESYFPLGDVEALASRIRKFSALTLTAAEREERRRQVMARYDWTHIADATRAVYERACPRATFRAASLGVPDAKLRRADSEDS